MSQHFKALSAVLPVVLREREGTVGELPRAFQSAPWTLVKHVVWNSNLGNEYFIKNLTLSHRFDIYIDCMFKRQRLDIGLYYGRDLQYSGENAEGIEIKRDMMVPKTGNLYIAYEERHCAGASSWVVSDVYKAETRRGTSRGFLIPAQVAETMEPS